MSGGACFTPCSLLGMWVDRRGSDDKLQSAVLTAAWDVAVSGGEKKETRVTGKNWVEFSPFREDLFFFCIWSQEATPSSTHAHEMDNIIFILVTWSSNSEHLIYNWAQSHCNNGSNGSINTIKWMVYDVKITVESNFIVIFYRKCTFQIVSESWEQQRRPWWGRCWSFFLRNQQNGEEQDWVHQMDCKMSEVIWCKLWWFRHEEQVNVSVEGCSGKKWQAGSLDEEQRGEWWV